MSVMKQGSCEEGAKRCDWVSGEDDEKVEKGRARSKRKLKGSRFYNLLAS